MEDVIKLRSAHMKRLHQKLLRLKEGEEKYDLIYGLYVYFLFSTDLERSAIYNLFSMLSKIYGMSDVSAWDATLKVSRDIARKY